MSKKNYDDWAAFCGPKGFYDLDGDGHLDGFEAAMMIGDTVDEMNSSKRHRAPPPLSEEDYMAMAKGGWIAALIWININILADLAY